MYVTKTTCEHVEMAKVQLVELNLYIKSFIKNMIIGI